MTIFTPSLEANDVLAEIDAFVASSPYGMMMQSPRWAKVKANWNADYVYLTDEAGNITATLSIISVTQKDGTVFMYAPRGPVCDLHDTETVQALLAEAAKVAQARKGFLLRIDPEVVYDPKLVETYRNLGYVVRSREIEDPKAFSNPRCNMVLDLTQKTEEAVMEEFSSRFRGKIRKTYKSGLVTHRYSAEHPEFEAKLAEFYELTKIMAERQGILFRPLGYFRDMLKAFSDSCLLITYDAEGQPLSGSLLVGYNRKLFYVYAASSNEKRNLYPAVQTNWEGIKYALAQGYSEYDMGGVFVIDPENGLYRFKKEICGESGLRELIGEIDVVYNQVEYETYIANS